jgi:enterochelin esterase family protein
MSLILNLNNFVRRILGKLVFITKLLFIPVATARTVTPNAPIDRAGEFQIGPEYRPAPELSPAPTGVQGTMHQFVLDSHGSRFYPGIARDAPGTVDPNNPKALIVAIHPQRWQRAITVYIPQQYRGGMQAPLLVVHDGPALGASDRDLLRVLDNLIAQGRVPAMIAVLIQNGGGDAQGSQRGLEYDTVSGKFAEFIEQEVLPQVELRYQVRLTHDPDARAVMGCSSGAAAAFTMAWFHPEWYHRVISYSGTFVNQQWPFNPSNPGGAWDYHQTMIHDTAAKPIRVWLQVGERDLVNINALRDGMHDWVLANRRMAAALKDQGYQYQSVLALDAGHGDNRVRQQTLPQALEWAWQGYKPGPSPAIDATSSNLR